MLGKIIAGRPRAHDGNRRVGGCEVRSSAPHVKHLKGESMKRAISALNGALVFAGIVGALSLVPAATSLASGTQPAAHTAGVCRISGLEERLGPTYVTYVAVGGGASCTQALKLVRSYYHCRIKHGGVTGGCSGVEGFRCTEHRYLKISVQFNANVTCTRGREVVRHTYTQFT
jgi:hypothetical protein